MLASDADPDVAPDGPLILTDGYRDRERFFGQLHDGYSATTLPGEPRHSDHPTRTSTSTPATTSGARRSELTGASPSLVASSSMGDANGAGGARPAESASTPPSTATSPPSGPRTRPPGSGRRGRSGSRSRAPSAAVRLVGARARRRSRPCGWSPTTAPASRSSSGPPMPRWCRCRRDPMSWLRVETVGQADDVPAALAEVEVPGVSVEKVLRMPTTPEAWGTPEAIVMTAAQDGRSGCVQVDGDVRCLPGRDVGGEEDTGFRRELELVGAASYEAEVRVPTPLRHRGRGGTPRGPAGQCDVVEPGGARRPGLRARRPRRRPRHRLDGLDRRLPTDVADPVGGPHLGQRHQRRARPGHRRADADHAPADLPRWLAGGGPGQPWRGRAHPRAHRLPRRRGPPDRLHQQRRVRPVRHAARCRHRRAAHRGRTVRDAGAAPAGARAAVRQRPGRDRQRRGVPAPPSRSPRQTMFDGERGAGRRCAAPGCCGCRRARAASRSRAATSSAPLGSCSARRRTPPRERRPCAGRATTPTRARRTRRTVRQCSRSARTATAAGRPRATVRR